MTVTPEQLQTAAEDLATRFLDAVASQSVEACMQLMPPLDEWRLLTNSPRMSKLSHRMFMKKQCRSFFKKYDRYFERNGERLTRESVAAVRVKELDEMMRGHEWFRRAETTATVELRTDEGVQDGGNITALRFEIEFAVMLGSSQSCSKLWVHNFESVTASVSVDSTTKHVAPLAALGFRQVDKSEFDAVFESAPRGYLSLAKQWNSIQLFEGDLTLTTDDLKLLDNMSAVITGNLTVDGVLLCGDIEQLFVLGDVHASSIIISDTSCLFAGITRVDEALFILSGGTSTNIAAAYGPLVVNDSESALVGVNRKNVEVCQDWEADNVWGDPAQLLQSAFVTSEGGETLVDTSATYGALVAGQPIVAPR